MDTTLHINTMADWDTAAHTLLTPLPSNQTAATLVTFSGDLGAGKTTMVQAIAKALQVTESVTSPTFTVMRRYELTGQAFNSLVHVDAYRIEDEREMMVLHFEHIIAEAGTLICVEWPEKIPTLVQEPTATVAIDFVPGSEKRTITIHV